MAYFHGLIFAALFFLAQAAANAQPVAPTPGPGFRAVSSNGSIANATGPTAAQAGANWRANAIAVFPGLSTCTHGFRSGSTTLYAIFWSAACFPGAPSSGEAQNATISAINNFPTCPSGYTLQGGMCQPPDTCAPKTGNTGRNWFTFTGPVPTTTVVQVDGCNASFTPDSCVGYDGTTYCEGRYTFNGDPSGTPPPTTPPPSTDPAQASQAQQGLCPGTVNGVSVNVPCSTSSTPSTPTQTVTNPDGSSSTTTTSTSCSGDGSCTTTTTTNTFAAGGAPTGTTVTQDTKPRETFCQENPQLAICKQSFFTASCGTPARCDGDAIQCAQARILKEQQCAMTPDAASQQAYADALANPNPENPNDGTVAVTSAMFDSTSLIGAGSCSLDKQITVWNTSVTLPFSQVCTTLEYLGTLLQALGFLLAFRIVSRG